MCCFPLTCAPLCGFSTLSPPAPSGGRQRAASSILASWIGLAVLHTRTPGCGRSPVGWVPATFQCPFSPAPLDSSHVVLTVFSTCRPAIRIPHRAYLLFSFLPLLHRLQDAVCDLAIVCFSTSDLLHRSSAPIGFCGGACIYVTIDPSFVVHVTFPIFFAWRALSPSTYYIFSFLGGHSYSLPTTSTVAGTSSVGIRAHLPGCRSRVEHSFPSAPFPFSLYSTTIPPSFNHVIAFKPRTCFLLSDLLGILFSDQLVSSLFSSILFLVFMGHYIRLSLSLSLIYYFCEWLVHLNSLQFCHASQFLFFTPHSGTIDKLLLLPLHSYKEQLHIAT